MVSTCSPPGLNALARAPGFVLVAFQDKGVQTGTITPHGRVGGNDMSLGLVSESALAQEIRALAAGSTNLPFRSPRKGARAGVTLASPATVHPGTLWRSIVAECTETTMKSQKDTTQCSKTQDYMIHEGT